jgi:peroxiredoxin
MPTKPLPTRTVWPFRCSVIWAEIVREYGLYKEYDKFNTQLPGARRATYLIDKDGKVVEMQVDQEAVDPTKTVVACERRKLKG